MTFNAKPKRKNSDPPPFPAWVVVLAAIGVVLIAVVMLRPASRNTSAAVSELPPCASTPTPVQDTSILTATAQGLDPLELTATAIVQEATNAVPCQPSTANTVSDPILLTATAIIQDATAHAMGTPQPGNNSALDDDPILLTATAIIDRATQTAAALFTEHATTTDMDSFALTATAIVQQVTDTASTPAS